MIGGVILIGEKFYKVMEVNYENDVYQKKNYENDKCP